MSSAQHLGLRQSVWPVQLVENSSDSQAHVTAVSYKLQIASKKVQVKFFAQLYEFCSVKKDWK